MKSVLKSMFVVLLGVLLLSGAPFANFSTAEASTGIISDERKLDLEISGDGLTAQTFQLSNVAPGDSGQGVNSLFNAGDLVGELSISFSEVRNIPGTIGEYADGSGDLGANIEIAVYIDVDVSGDWNSGDIGLRSDGTTYSHPAPLNYDYLV